MLSQIAYIFLSLGQPPAFVQCGDFIYPLIPGKSPVLRRDGYKVYMFPELSGEEGGSTGLLLRSAPESELEELDHVRTRVYNGNNDSAILLLE